MLQAGESIKKNEETKLRKVLYVREPHTNDVLCGRGHGINCHPGNVYFRSLVNRNKEAYVQSSKKHKREISQHILCHLKALKPPSRVLRKDPKSFNWYEIDDHGSKGALAKIRQVLREKAPQMLKRLEQIGVERNAELLENPLRNISHTAISTKEEVQEHQEAVKSQDYLHSSGGTSTSRGSSAKTKFNDFSRYEMQKKCRKYYGDYQTKKSVEKISKFKSTRVEGVSKKLAPDDFLFRTSFSSIESISLDGLETHHRPSTSSLLRTNETNCANFANIFDE